MTSIELLQDRLARHPEEYLEICQSLLEFGRIEINYEFIRLFVPLIEKGKSEVSVMIINNLHQFAVPMNGGYVVDFAKYLLNYSSSIPTAGIILIDAYPVLVKEKWIWHFIKFGGGSLSNLEWLKALIIRISTQSVNASYKLEDIIIPLLENHPWLLTDILETLAVQNIRLPLYSMVEYFIRRRQIDFGNPKLCLLLAKTSSQPAKILELLIIDNPELTIQLIEIFAISGKIQPYDVEDIIISQIHSGARDDQSLIILIDKIYNKAPIPKKILVGLFASDKFSQDFLSKYSVSPNLYEAWFDKIDWLKDLATNNTEQIKVARFCYRLAWDTNFTTLPLGLRQTFIRSVCALPASSEKDQVRLLILELIKMDGSTYYSGLARDWTRLINQEQAKTLWQSVQKAQEYTFIDNDLIITIIASLSENDQKICLKKQFRSVFIKNKYQFQNILESLVVMDLNKFNYWFIKYNKPLGKGFGKYDKFPAIKSAAWKKLGIRQKLLNFFSF